MGAWSIWHWMVLLICWLAVGLPLWKIVRKTGHHPALSLLLWVPMLNIAVLWFLALSAWPAKAGGDEL